MSEDQEFSGEPAGLPFTAPASFCGMVEHSPTFGSIAKALALVQVRLRPAPRNKHNPHFKSDYADLESCYSVARELLGEQQVSVLQFPGPMAADNRLRLVTVLVHPSGEYFAVLTSVPMPGKGEVTPQVWGSALAYARRYSFNAILGIAAGDDDDGTAASQPQGKAAKPQTEQDDLSAAYRQFGEWRKEQFAKPETKAAWGGDAGYRDAFTKWWDQFEPSHPRSWWMREAAPADFGRLQTAFSAATTLRQSGLAKQLDGEAVHTDAPAEQPVKPEQPAPAAKEKAPKAKDTKRI